MTRRKPYFEPALPHVLAHRGLHTSHPENTLAAFGAALAAGATHIETDAHVSADGVAVLVHDPTLLLSGRRIVISECSARELESLDVGGGESIPSLDAALGHFPQARFNIDIKVAGAAVPVAQAIERHDAQDRVLIASFTAAHRVATTKLLPGVATSASAVVSLLSVLCATVGFTWLGRLILSRVDAVQLPMSMLGLRVFTPRFISMCHAADVHVHAWTINEPGDMRRLLDVGVDGLVTDRCDLATAIPRNKARSDSA